MSVQRCSGPDNGLHSYDFLSHFKPTTFTRKYLSAVKLHSLHVKHDIMSKSGDLNIDLEAVSPLTRPSVKVRCSQSSVAEVRVLQLQRLVITAVAARPWQERGGGAEGLY